jgi:glycosyltransferase involved in cell wall biosynthesis
MINVCYLVDAPFLGGAERFVFRIASGLDRSRFKSSVIMQEPHHPSSALYQWRLELEAAGVPVRSLPMDIPFRPYRAVKVIDAIAEASAHVVHVNMPGPQDGQMGLLIPIARMAGANAVVTTEHLPMVDTTTKRGLLRRVSYHWVDRVTTVCHANVPYLVGKHRVPANKVAVIHNALDVAYGTRERDQESRSSLRDGYGLPKDSIVIAFLGNLFRHKGLHRVLRALSRVPELPWHLVVVGDGPERGSCERRLKRWGLADRGTFLGRISPPEVERMLSVVDVLTLPSTQEGMPYVILEAMAAGVPVVATAVYGIPEMVVDGETGLLVEPSDDGGLRCALVRLIEHAAERESMGVAARERFERLFTLDGQIGAFESLYEKVIP